MEQEKNTAAIIDKLKTLLAIEQLEYNDKNWLSGSDTSRSEKKQQMLEELINETEGITSRSVAKNAVTANTDAGFKKGDTVLVWSLQSFNHGGFLNGVPAFVTQDEDDGGSILLTLYRRIGGIDEVDDAYEVYPQQIRRVTLKEWPARAQLKELRKVVLFNQQW